MEARKLAFSIQIGIFWVILLCFTPAMAMLVLAEFQAGLYGAVTCCLCATVFIYLVLAAFDRFLDDKPKSVDSEGKGRTLNADYRQIYVCRVRFYHHR